MNLNLVVRVLSFFSLPDGEPKSWQHGRILPTQVVDMHSFNVLQLVNFIAEHFMWGSKQHITLWRALEDTFSGDSIEIKTDEQLLEWFELNKDKENVYINAQINDFEGPLQFSPTKRRCHPCVRNRVPTNETNTAERPTSINEKERATRKKRAIKKRDPPNKKKRVMIMRRV